MARVPLLPEPSNLPAQAAATASLVAATVTASAKPDDVPVLVATRWWIG